MSQHAVSADRLAEDRRGVPRAPRRSDIALDFDDRPAAAGGVAARAARSSVDGVRVGNRFCILPMEGWDGTPDGRADAS